MSGPMTIDEARDLTQKLATDLGVPAGPVGQSAFLPVLQIFVT
jgi:hypothetical protein